METGNEDQLNHIQINKNNISRYLKILMLSSDGIHDYLDIDFPEDTLNRDDISLEGMQIL